MAEYLFGQRQTRRHQKCGPVNRMEADNVLADNMHAGGPVFAPFLGIVGKADARNIGRQRVEPDIHDMVFATRNFHAPVEAGPRHRKIAQTAFYKADGFVPAAFRANEIGLVFIEFEQLLFIFGQPEKPGFLGGPLNRRTLWREFRCPLPRRSARFSS